MRILLFGKNGQVGWELQRSLAPLGEVLARGRADRGSERTNSFEDAGALAAIVRETRPDVIVNAAAYTAVDQAEAEPDRAHSINARAPGELANAALSIGALLVHYSTDYVFDGTGSAPRQEDAQTGPLNVYGASKLAGEEAIRGSGCRHLIFRTSWVFASRGQNFARTILRLAAEKDSLTVIDDQWGAPTGADLLADVSAHAIRAVRSAPDKAGTYHVVAAGEVSWHGYAQHVVRVARENGLSLRVQEVLPVPSSAYVTPARRPLNSRMSTERFRTVFDLDLPDWKYGVDRMLAEVTSR